MKIDALTVWQPWTSLIAEELKPFEFRNRKPPDYLIGRPLAIHAGKRAPVIAEIRGLIYKLERGGEHALSTGLINHERCMRLLEQWIAAPAALPLSSILCIATVGKPLTNADLCEALGLRHINDSDRDLHSNWGWPLSDVERLTPFVPISGQRGIWKWEQPPRFV